MSKPDWKDAPQWANFLAQDESGHWFWYEKEPRVGARGNWVWGSNNKFCSAFARNDGDGWTETLESRP